MAQGASSAGMTKVSVTVTWPPLSVPKAERTALSVAVIYIVPGLRCPGSTHWPSLIRRPPSGTKVSSQWMLPLRTCTTPLGANGPAVAVALTRASRLRAWRGLSHHHKPGRAQRIQRRLLASTRSLQHHPSHRLRQLRKQRLQPGPGIGDRPGLSSAMHVYVQTCLADVNANDCTPGRSPDTLKGSRALPHSPALSLRARAHSTVRALLGRYRHDDPRSPTVAKAQGHIRSTMSGSRHQSLRQSQEIRGRGWMRSAVMALVDRGDRSGALDLLAKAMALPPAGSPAPSPNPLPQTVKLLGERASRARHSAGLCSRALP